MLHWVKGRRKMFRIGELSSISGTPVQTIRFYESEGLIRPVMVDRWTNYRYYDASSVVRLGEISYLKDLGFSLKEIKNFDERAIEKKINSSRAEIEKLKQNIDKLTLLQNKDGGMEFMFFLNDEDAIGKWRKLGIVKSRMDFENGIFSDEKLFNFDEIYFLKGGEPYWVFKWTKNTIYVKDHPFPYMIRGDKMYVGITDANGNIDDYAVYEKVDSIAHNRDEIRVRDNTDIPFIPDPKVVGFWEVVDFVKKPASFNPKKPKLTDKLILEKYAFEPNGKLIMTIDGTTKTLDYSKGLVLDHKKQTASEYIFKTIGGDEYMIVEWKSGDYTFGGKINGYYVLKKM